MYNFTMSNIGYSEKYTLYIVIVNIKWVPTRMQGSFLLVNCKVMSTCWKVSHVEQPHVFSMWLSNMWQCSACNLHYRAHLMEVFLSKQSWRMQFQLFYMFRISLSNNATLSTFGNASCREGSILLTHSTHCTYINAYCFT